MSINLITISIIFAITIVVITSYLINYNKEKYTTINDIVNNIIEEIKAQNLDERIRLITREKLIRNQMEHLNNTETNIINKFTSKYNSDLNLYHINEKMLSNMTLETKLQICKDTFNEIKNKNKLLLNENNNLKYWNEYLKLSILKNKEINNLKSASNDVRRKSQIQLKKLNDKLNIISLKLKGIIK